MNDIKVLGKCTYTNGILFQVCGQRGDGKRLVSAPTLARLINEKRISNATIVRGGATKQFIRLASGVPSKEVDKPIPMNAPDKMTQNEIQYARAWAIAEQQNPSPTLDNAFMSPVFKKVYMNVCSAKKPEEKKPVTKEEFADVPKKFLDWADAQDNSRKKEVVPQTVPEILAMGRKGGECSSDTFQNLTDTQVDLLYKKFTIDQGMRQDDAFGEIQSIDCNLDNEDDEDDTKEEVTDKHFVDSAQQKLFNECGYTKSDLWDLDDYLADIKRLHDASDTDFPAVLGDMVADLDEVTDFISEFLEDPQEVHSNRDYLIEDFLECKWGDSRAPELDKWFHTYEDRNKKYTGWQPTSVTFDEDGDVVVAKDDCIKVSLVNLDEGLSGDYDENDPDDVNLLRFDVYYRNPEEGLDDWEPVDDASYCTNVEANSTKEHLEKVVRTLFKRYRDEYRNIATGGSVKKMGEELSHIS